MLADQIKDLALASSSACVICAVTVIFRRPIVNVMAGAGVYDGSSSNDLEYLLRAYKHYMFRPLC